jgi:histidine ammonia-lyase
MSGPTGDVRFGASPATVSDIVAIAEGAHVVLDADARERIAASRAVVEHAIEAGEPVYGLNRRLGAGRDDAVTADELAEFQRRTIANHRGGVGEPLAEVEARAVVAARLAGFARGGAGVRPELADAYAALLNARVTPWIPSRGSVGAADLTALAEVAAVAIGTGVVLHDGAEVPAAEALAEAGLQPIDLAPHEALAALSANALSVGVGSLAAVAAHRLAESLDLVVALSLEAVGAEGPAGNLSPYSQAVSDARGGRGQAASARAIRAALEGSGLHATERVVSVQDPLAFRTAPQLHGALREAIARLRNELEVELAARAENPVVDLPSGRLVSGGNFEALPLALALENLRLALAHVAEASERRAAALSLALAPARREGRTRVPGLLLYAAADGVAEVRQLAAPATLGSSTLSGVEDHATYAPLALRLLQRSLAHTTEVVAIEALHAADLLGVLEAVPTGAGTGRLAAAIAEAFVDPDDGRSADALVAETSRLLTR